MTDEEMAAEYANQSCFTERENPSLSESIDISDDIKQAYLAGLKAGRPQWHYVKDELPEISGRYYVYTGGEPFILDYDTECSSFGYWTILFGDNRGVIDEVFETVEDREEDEVIAWCELPIMDKQGDII